MRVVSVVRVVRVVRSVEVLFSLVAVSSIIVACSVADIPGDGSGVNGVNGNGSTKVETAGTAVPCTEGEPEKLDITKLTACECKAGGKAHCVAAAKMPANMASKLDKCDGDQGRCIPDTIITSEKPPPACKTGGKDGRCLSMCLSEVSGRANSLSRGDEGAACAEDERCIPCLSPLDDKPTGICELAAVKPAEKCTSPQGGKAPGTGIGTAPDEPITCPFSGTPVVSTKPQCGENNGGRCIDAAAIPKDIAARLRTCDGGGTAALCVPEVYVKEKGQHKPGACSSFAGIEGRCFSTIFKDVDEQREFLQQDKCNADERCVPCFNPATGAETPACRSVSCDAPTTTPPKLADCCSQGGQPAGKCLPKTDVPSKYQTRVQRQTCPSTDLCVPSENLNPETKIQKDCDEDGEKSVCVSNCIKFGFLEGIVLDQGKCDSNHTCVPCTDLRGAPTGAPGCT